MIRKAIIAAATLSTIALPAVASADPVIGQPAPCVKVTDLVGPDFFVKQCGVSDVDQHRAGLENNGSAYCGPTSLYNVLHYWAHEKNAPVGWLTTKVMNLDPQDQADYNVITNSIGRIGEDAQYNGGTNLYNLRTAWNIATKPARDAGWATVTYPVNTDGAADFGGDLAKRLARGPVQMVYGRYSAGPKTGSLQRGGGHIVTLVSVEGSFNGDTLQVRYMDPGRASDHGVGDYLKTQSDYATINATMTKKTVVEWVPTKNNPDNDLGDIAIPGTYRTVTRWHITTPGSTATTTQLVEGYNFFEMAPPVG